MRFDSAVNEIITLLKNSSELDNTVVAPAYPYSLKPTRPEAPRIAVGLANTALESIGIDETDRSGQLGIFVDIFVPLQLGGEAATEILSKVCKVLGCYSIVSIKAQKPEYSKTAQAVVLRTEITFSDRITFGGEDNE